MKIAISLFLILPVLAGCASEEDVVGETSSAVVAVAHAPWLPGAVCPPGTLVEVVDYMEPRAQIRDRLCLSGLGTVRLDQTARYWGSGTTPYTNGSWRYRVFEVVIHDARVSLAANGGLVQTFIGPMRLDKFNDAWLTATNKIIIERIGPEPTGCVRKWPHEVCGSQRCGVVADGCGGQISCDILCSGRQPMTCNAAGTLCGCDEPPPTCDGILTCDPRQVVRNACGESIVCGGRLSCPAGTQCCPRRSSTVTGTCARFCQ